MQLLEQVTVGPGGAANITFSAIPDTYTDLLVLVSLRSSQTDFAVTDALVNFNGSGANLTQKNLRGYQSGILTQTRTDLLLGNMPSAINTAGAFSNSSMYVSNYASSVAKSVTVDGVSPSSGTGTYDWWVNLHGSLWNSTSPITSIVIAPSTGVLVEHSSASLYGILAGSDGTTAVS